jgi:hypothetical protein
MSHFQEVEFGQGDDNIGTKGKAFKAEAGVSYRVSFLYFNGLKDGAPDFSGPPKFEVAPCHYIEKVGFVVSTGPDVVKEAGSAAKNRLATVIVVWKTDSDGVLNAEENIKGRKYQVLPWIISEDKYQTLKKIYAHFPYGKHDILMTCKDKNFQKLDFIGLPDSFLQKIFQEQKLAVIKEDILAKGMLAAESLKDSLGRELTVAQIRAKKDPSSATSVSPVSSSGPSVASDSDIDSLLDTFN